MRDRYRKIIIACGVVTLLSLGTSAVATAQTSTITDLGTSVHVAAINNVGQVVGAVTTANGLEEHAALWQKDSQGTYRITDLGTLSGTLSGGTSRASGINDAGQVVGSAMFASGSGAEHAALWEKDSQGAYSITDLGTLGGVGSTAFAINAAGQVVGAANTANGETHAALWQKDSQGAYRITDLGTLGGDHSTAYAINAAGQVVGEAKLPRPPQLASGFTHAFLWQNGVMRDLGTLQVGIGDLGVTSKALGINAAGQVVGRSSKIVPGGLTGELLEVFRATIWQNGGITSLDTRIYIVQDDRGAFVQAGDSTAFAINAAGQVVGDSNTKDGIQRATLWQKDSPDSITDLDTLLPPGSGWRRLITAVAIIERGQIVGLGQFNDGLIHGYLLGPSVELLDPVPELLAGAAVTTVPELLASKGRPVLGAAADGVTQLVLRIPATSDVTLTVLDDQGQQSISLDETGSLGNIGGTPDRGSIVAPVVSTTTGSFAFALYRAPKDFARANNTGDLTAKSRAVQIRMERAGQATSQIPITIVRPPVVLIHGLWSNPSVWNDFPLFSDSRFQGFRANYKRFNGESINFNTHVVYGQLRTYLLRFKADSKVAAVQFDFVTHSMGGLITRNLATLPAYQRDFNYRAGDIHKLITLDTPHLGSQLANRLDASSSLCKLVFNLIGKKIGDAVKDLKVESPAIAQLLESTTPIKARVIAGQATLLQEVASTAAFAGLTSLRICRSLLPPGGFAELFRTPEDPNGHSDLIVSVISQLGKTIAVGRGDPPADAPYEGIEHTRIPVLLMLGPAATDDPTIGQRVIDLLNTSVATPDFGDILP